MRHIHRHHIQPIFFDMLQAFLHQVRTAAFGFEPLLTEQPVGRTPIGLILPQSEQQLRDCMHTKRHDLRYRQGRSPFVDPILPEYVLLSRHQIAEVLEKFAILWNSSH